MAWADLVVEVTGDSIVGREASFFRREEAGNHAARTPVFATLCLLYRYMMPSRVERKMLRILDKLGALDQQRLLVEAELEAHRHIDSDALRDAALGIERLEATSTRDDVARFERILIDINRRREDLENQRAHLLSRLNT